MTELQSTSSTPDRSAEMVSGINADAMVQTAESTEEAVVRALHLQNAQLRDNFEEVRHVWHNACTHPPQHR